jgi:hypothetical protein
MTCYIRNQRDALVDGQSQLIPIQLGFWIAAMLSDVSAVGTVPTWFGAGDQSRIMFLTTEHRTRNLETPREASPTRRKNGSDVRLKLENNKMKFSIITG